MERYWNFVAYAATLIVAWWAGLHGAYRVLLIFQAIDIATGVLIAIGQKEFRSNIGLAGLTRRAATWLFILGVAVLEHEAAMFISSASIIDGVGIAPSLAYVAAFFEFSSTVENYQRMGVKIPRWFIDALKKTERMLGLTAEEKVKK